jgi:two-component system response regulator TctD
LRQRGAQAAVRGSPVRPDDEVGSNAVEVYIHRLRRMLADSGATVQVHTVRGVGYMLAEAKGA